MSEAPTSDNQHETNEEELEEVPTVSDIFYLLNIYNV
jgi:hypothetical protein